MKTLTQKSRQPLAVRLVVASLTLGLLGGAVTQSCANRQSPGPFFRGMGPSWMWGRRREVTDQQFMVMMVSHHEAAIAMADLALNRARRAEIRELASKIKQSQATENRQMRVWYRDWYGKALPSWAPGDGWGWHHSRMMGAPLASSGAGRNRPQAIGIDSLSKAVDFDQAFIEQMVPHHQMGIIMATMQNYRTARPEMKKLTEEMIRVQGEEIRTMQAWYRDWYQ